MRLWPAFVLNCALSFECFAFDDYRQAKVDAYFAILKDMPLDLSSSDSAVEEELARLELYKTYPPQGYVIEKNMLVYGLDGLTKGELDLVVRLRSTGRVIVIAEVKRRRAALSASNQATSQLNRFEEALRTHEISAIRELEVGGRIVRLRDFSLPLDKRIIGVHISDSRSYPNEIDITYSELAALRTRIRQHQRDVYLGEREQDVSFKEFWRTKSALYDASLPRLLQRFDCAFYLN